MKHLKKGRKLGRVSGQRRALMKTMLGSLILKEKMTTTEAKAKELKPLIDKIINKAKKAKANPERSVTVLRDLNVRLAKVAAQKLLGEFLDRFSGRTSGYTRIVKLVARKSDGARMAVIEFV